MAFPKLPLSVIIISIIFAALGSLWGAQAAGIIDLNSIIANIPFIGKGMDQENNEVQISPLENENKKLQEKIYELEKQLAELEGNIRGHISEITELQKHVDDLEKEKARLQDNEKNSEQLASYYQEMKAKDIVPIFDKLDDQMVLSIMVKLETDHVAKILAEMDPIRAAKLTKVLTDINT